ncbi:MAG: hypothetical protein OXC99_04705 [Chloroflexi bacterium]|nr:hypothetical protein [Chloroflexota bacterium]
MNNNNAAPNHHDGDRRRKKRKPGGQPGNQNGRKRSLLDRTLTPEQRNALKAARRARKVPDVVNVVRIKLVALLSDPHADLDRLIRLNRMLMRMLRIESRKRSERERWG